MSGLPYQNIPQQVLVKLMNFVVLWLNAFQAKNGISSSLSPRELVTMQSLDYAKHCKAEFGTYCEVYK